MWIENSVFYARYTKIFDMSPEKIALVVKNQKYFDVETSDTPLWHCSDDAAND